MLLFSYLLCIEEWKEYFEGDDSDFTDQPE